MYICVYVYIYIYVLIRTDAHAWIQRVVEFGVVLYWAPSHVLMPEGLPLDCRFLGGDGACQLLVSNNMPHQLGWS